MQSVQAVLELMSTGRIKAKEVKAKLTRKKVTVTIPRRNPKAVVASHTRMEKAITVPKAVIAIARKNPKVAEANLTRTGKATTVPRVVMAIARKNPKVVAARPTRMGKGNMATKVVMENLMATKNHPPMEGMEVMVRVLLNTSCIINTNWV